PRVQDLFRYSSGGARSYTTAGDDAFFSLNGTTDLVQFNQNQQFGGGDFGDWHPSGTARVQDAFATPLATPTLATSAGLVEIVNLDAQGYNLATAAAAVPEPASLTLLGMGALVLTGYGWRRRQRSTKDTAA